MSPVATTELVKDARAGRTTIALKLLMAVSGIVFIGFVLSHMYGNLHAFQGHDEFNHYAEWLREVGEPALPHGGLLWILRAGLIAALVVHVFAAAVLSSRAAKARPVKYHYKKNKASSVSSRTMRWGGLTILLFLVWHLINFTIGKVNIQGGATDDPYNLLVDTFDVPWMTAIYLLAMVALGFHLHHGTFSAIQTLGFTNSAVSRKRARILGWIVALVVAGGFALTPLFITFGVITK